jgi:hypothetical protein
MNDQYQSNQGDFLEAPIHKSIKSYEGGEPNNEGKYFLS